MIGPVRAQAYELELKNVFNKAEKRQRLPPKETHFLSRDRSS